MNARSGGMPADQRPRNTGLDLYRHLLAIFVIMIHTWSASRYSTEMRLEFERLQDIVDGAVFGFFVLAGYLARFGKDLRHHALDRSRRLLVPYLLFSACYAVTGVFFGQGSLSGYLQDILLLRGSAMQLYFLPYLFLVDMTAAMLFARPRPVSQLKLALVLAALVVLALLFSTPWSTGSDPRLILFYAAGYVAGCLLAQGGKAISTALPCLALGIGLAIDPRFLDACLMLVLLLGFRAVFAARVRLPGSGGVYLLHTPVANFAISTLLWRAGIGEWANFSLTVVLTYLICLAAACAVIIFFPGQRRLILE